MTDVGPYQLERRLGDGGSGVVWLALGPDGASVALKLLPDCASRGALPEPFRQELRAHASLSHPNIVRLYDYGRTEDALQPKGSRHYPAGTPYIATEYASGGTLRSLPVRHWSELCDVLRQSLSALAFAHSRELVHRDLKPENILVFEPDRDLKLADFGLVQALQSARELGHSTSTVPRAGTPAYMAPEQIDGEWRHFGPWTDLYALGCLAYELASGRLPFDYREIMAMLRAHLHERVPPLNARFPVPDGFESWLRRLMAKKTHHRFHRAADALDVLDQMDHRFEAAGRTAEKATEQESHHTAAVEPPARLLDHTTQPLHSQVLPTVALTDLIGFDDAPPEPETEDDSEEPESTRPRSKFQPPPAMPSDWRSASDDADVVHSLGLNLFDLREFPFVDRLPERDHLWSALGDVVSGAGNRVVLIDGPAGTGKTRLARWMARRVHETGMGHTLAVRNRPENSPAETLRNMLRDFFRCWELEPNSTYQQIATSLKRFAGDLREDVTEQARALTALVHGNAFGGEHGYRLESERQQFIVLRELLRFLSRDRPVLVTLDDAQWNTKALGFIRHVLDRPKHLPVLFVATLRSDLLPDLPLARDIVESTDARSATTRIELEPLELEDQHRFVDELLPLDADIGDTVVEKSEGNPLFAVQIVGHWIEEGLLEKGDADFRFRDDADPYVPDACRDIWHRRIDKLLETYSEERRPDIRRSLQLAATLGRDVHSDIWRRACDELELSPPDSLPRRLIDRGLARKRNKGWSFIHGMLVETLRERTDAEGRARRFHRSAARALESEKFRTLENGEQRADHWRAAGELEPAVAALFDAAVQASTDKTLQEEKRLLEERDELLDRLDAPEDDRRRVAGWCRLAANARRRGDRDRAGELSRRAKLAAESNDWDAELGGALRVLGLLDRDAHNHRRAEKRLRRAQSLFSLDDERTQHARTVAGRCVNQIMSGNFEKARQLALDAIDLFDQHDNPTFKIAARVYLADCSLEQGDLEPARETIQETLRETRDVGATSFEAGCLLRLGEIERKSGNLDAAYDHYQDAWRLFERQGSRTVSVVRLNMGMVDAARGQTERARATFSRLRDELPGHALENRLPRVRLGAILCAAQSGAWRKVDQKLRAFREEDLDTASLAFDDAWLCERIGEVAEEHDEPDALSAAWRLAADIWSRIGEPENAENARSHF